MVVPCLDFLACNYPPSNHINNNLLVLILLPLEIPGFNTNSVDPDQMSPSVASDLGLHCFPFTQFRVFRLRWITG